jgi:hypothetical protein
MDKPSPDSSPTPVAEEQAQTLPSPRRSAPSTEGDAGLRSGGKVGRFFLLDRVGEGGMGLVWAAYDPQLDRKVALKFVHAGAADPSGASLLREAQAIAKVSHPNVVAVHDVGADGDRVYLAEEFVRGSDLSAWLRARRALGRADRRGLPPAAQGLAAAHAAGVVHRDFKPANAIVGEDDGRARVVDFGLACSSPAGAASGAPPAGPDVDIAPLSATARSPALGGSDRTAPGTVLGTPLYMSPEQHAGQPADARSDQFSFCASLYEALYGELPFEGRTLQELAWAKTRGAVRPPPRGTRVPGRLREVLLRGLQADAARRHPSMEALVAALGRAAAPRGRRLAQGAVAAAVLVAAAVAVAGVVQQRRGLCRGAERKLAGVWDEARRRAVREAFLATGAPYAPRALQGAQEGLDAYGRELVAMHQEACEATRLRGEQSEEALDLRMGCLSRRLKELGAAADLFARADAQVVRTAAQVVAGLAPLADCADVAALKAPLAPPRDEAARRRVDAVRDEVARPRCSRRPASTPRPSRWRRPRWPARTSSTTRRSAPRPCCSWAACASGCARTRRRRRAWRRPSWPRPARGTTRSRRGRPPCW